MIQNGPDVKPLLLKVKNLNIVFVPQGIAKAIGGINFFMNEGDNRLKFRKTSI